MCIRDSIYPFSLELFLQWMEALDIVNAKASSRLYNIVLLESVFWSHALVVLREALVWGENVRTAHIAEIEVLLLFLDSALAFLVEFLLGSLAKAVGIQRALDENMIVSLIWFGLYAWLAVGIFTRWSRLVPQIGTLLDFDDRIPFLFLMLIK